MPNPAYPASGPPAFPISWKKCVDLAGGKPLPKANHHNTVHQGNAGRALLGAGHMVAPYSCAYLAQMVG